MSNETPTAESPKPNEIGASAITGQPEFTTPVDGASNGTPSNTPAPSVPRRPRGRPRKNPLPVGAMGNGPGAAPMGQSSPQLVPVDFETNSAPTAAASFDAEAAEALIDGIICGLNDFAAYFQRNAALTWLADSTIADAVAAGARMSEKVEKTIKAGAMACARKYAVDLEYAPELTLFGGLALWTGGNYLAYKRIIEQGKKMRQPGEKAAA